jgi:hypothetical protein
MIKFLRDAELWGEFYAVELPTRGEIVYVRDETVGSELLAQQIAELDQDTQPPNRPTR